MRLDKLLVTKGFASGRARAKEMIERGTVFIDSNKILDADTDVSEESKIQIRGNTDNYVSRSAQKLQFAIKTWKSLIANKVCLDIGASTGGFTQILLENNASKVFALDVGHGQLHEKIKSDSKVINMEGINVKSTNLAFFGEKMDIIVIDVSFISLLKVLPFAQKLLKDEGEIIALIKPQFEVGKSHIKKGVVKDPALHEKILDTVKKETEIMGFIHTAIIPSPIEGGDGNKEFLIRLKLKS